ncbi:MAG TPA: hypothetical protein VGP03_04685 [Pseudonocardiaceae bacterium]|nr:hypothetical protein [Pseudonocardiaceae bacterium]
MDKVVVSVVDDKLDVLPKVVADLRRAGLVVDEVLEPLGVVTGSIEPDAIWSLETVPGVSGVERQRTVRLSPPTSPS